MPKCPTAIIQKPLSNIQYPAIECQIPDTYAPIPIAQ